MRILRILIGIPGLWLLWLWAWITKPRKMNRDGLK